MITQILLLALIITIILLATVIWKVALLIKASYDRRLDLDEYAVHQTQDPTKSRELLNNLIGAALVEWSLYNIRSEEESYMTDQKRDACMQWIVDKVIREMTPTLIDHISAGYPYRTQEEQIKTTISVANLHVLEFCIKQNSKDMSDDIPNINMVNLDM